MIEKFTITNNSSRVLFEKLMPGSLTLVLKKSSDSPIPKILTGGLPTLGFRIPDYKITKMLSESLNIPYTTPSANRSGEPAPYSIEEVKKVLDLSEVDLVLDAGGLDRNIKPSTIVDLSSNVPKILREGPITEEDILSLLGFEK